MRNSRFQNIISSKHIRFNSLHREELTAGDLLQGCSCENIVNSSTHGYIDTLTVAHIANIEFHFSCLLRILCLQMMTHVILLFLITTENADFPNVGIQKTLQYHVTEGTGAACNQQDFIFKN